jgi:hypothetical protein
MSVGTGILLSSLVFAIVILYGITKDRWRWRRIVGRTALIVAAIMVLTGAISGGLYLWDRLPMTLVPQTEYAGLRLGISPDEVMYIKGYPPTVYAEAPDPPPADWPGAGWQEVIHTKDVKKGQRVQDYREWSYENDDQHSRIDVTFNPQKTAVIVIECYSDDRLGRCPSIAGISDGASEQEVVRKLGKPERSSIEGVTKSLYYSAVGVRLVLSKERVYMLGINDQKYKRRSP